MAKKWTKFPHADKASRTTRPPSRSTGRACIAATASRSEDARRCSTRGASTTPAISSRRSRSATRRAARASNAAVKAQVVYAQLSREVRARRSSRCSSRRPAGRTRARKTAPKDANAHYLYAFALGRYGQGISVAKALAQGFGGKIKEALTTALKLAPKHAEAHTAFGAYQSEVIDKVGALVAGMTYGAKKDSAVEHFEKALKIFPESPIAHIEYANGLIRLFGKARIDEATKLYEKAAARKPMDAMERLDVELAKSELE